MIDGYWLSVVITYTYLTNWSLSFSAAWISFINWATALVLSSACNLAIISRICLEMEENSSVILATWLRYVLKSYCGALCKYVLWALKKSEYIIHDGIYYKAWKLPRSILYSYQYSYPTIYHRHVNR